MGPALWSAGLLFLCTWPLPLLAQDLQGHFRVQENEKILWSYEAGEQRYVVVSDGKQVRALVMGKGGAVKSRYPTGDVLFFILPTNEIKHLKVHDGKVTDLSEFLTPEGLERLLAEKARPPEFILPHLARSLWYRVGSVSSADPEGDAFFLILVD